MNLRKRDLLVMALALLLMALAVWLILSLMAGGGTW